MDYESQGGGATADGAALDWGRGYPGGWKRVGSASYGEDLKQAELSGVTLLLSSINQHGHGDVFHVLRKQYNEEDGPGTETNKTTPGLASWGSS